jgi:hypothetical protein
VFYATINEVKKFRVCSDGPKVDKHFSARYGPDDPISMLELLEAFDGTIAMFGLRVVKGGPQFAVKCAITAAARALPVFQERFPDCPLAENSLRVAGLRLVGDIDATSCKSVGRECEAFCKQHMLPEDDKARKAGMACARAAFSAYALHVAPTCVDYAIGACEDACEAADDMVMEAQWQTEALRAALLAHKPEEE